MNWSIVTTSTTRTAAKFEDRDGTREIAQFHGPSGRRVLCVTHLPAEDAVAGLVVCSPIHAEFIQNYRREVSLGRRLAARGIAVQRFHYRGSGNSDGDIETMTFESMKADAFVTTERLKQRAGVSRLAFLGSRLGSVIAAQVASAFPEAALALWDPVIDVNQYFRDMGRYRLMHQLKGDSTGGVQRASIAEELRLQTVADVLGYSVSKGLYDSFAGRDLLTELGDTPRSLLLLQLGRAQHLRAEYEEARRRWMHLHFRIQTATVGDPEAWWFSTRPSQDASQRGQELVEETIKWLTDSSWMET
jgi:alpha/beta superfamily hydrolase